jgi:hypothetical protein
MTHDKARELLPWLLNDSLQTHEHEQVREHAAHCVICRRELVELRSLRNSIASADTVHAIPDPDMRRINARIDAFVAKENRWRDWLARLREFGDSPWRIVFAAQTAVLIAVAAVLLWPSVERPEYTTLTVPETLPEGQYFRVVFEPALPAAELSSLLETLQLSIIDGPSGQGVYTLKLPAVASIAERDALLAKLQASNGVSFAQPVTGGTTP